MTKKIFRGILTSAIITMLLSLVFIVGVQYRIYRDGSYSALEKKAYLISLSADEDELQKYSSATERITLVDKNGDVLYDNKAKASEMELRRSVLRKSLQAFLPELVITKKNTKEKKMKS